MNFGHYTTRGAALAVDLVNALKEHGMRNRPSVLSPQAAWHPDSAERLRDIAVRLRVAFTADDVAEGADAVNELLASLPLTPRLSGHDEQPAHLHYAPRDADPVTRLACNATMAVAAVISEHGISRLNLCAASACGTAFVDTSRNGRRRFCSTACANRVHVAAHRRRAQLERDQMSGP